MSYGGDDSSIPDKLRLDYAPTSRASECQSGASPCSAPSPPGAAARAARCSSVAGICRSAAATLSSASGNGDGVRRRHCRELEGEGCVRAEGA